ncbi:hypothetical protein ACH4SP_05290 [Streptomyces sp. NPDC021093]|uniref:hypothetical protein n=1 Tax=Streptomyces sp. NPDC021093 TaxID=3365112 RepID=UPI00378BEE4E
MKLHKLLLTRIRAGTVEELYLYQDAPLRIGEQLSVSCFAAVGTDCATLPQPGVLVPDEEAHWPRACGQPDILIGSALVSHLSFFPQQPFLQAGGVLEHYQKEVT